MSSQHPALYCHGLERRSTRILFWSQILEGARAGAMLPALLIGSPPRHLGDHRFA